MSVFRVRTCQDDYLTPTGMERYGFSASIVFQTREDAEMAHQKLIDMEPIGSMGRMFAEDYWVEESDA